MLVFCAWTRGATLTGMEDRRIRFNEFVDAVVMSPPLRDVRRQGDVSVLYPEHYLAVSQPPPTPAPPAPYLPPQLAMLQLSV